MTPVRVMLDPTTGTAKRIAITSTARVENPSMKATIHGVGNTAWFGGLDVCTLVLLRFFSSLQILSNKLDGSYSVDHVRPVEVLDLGAVADPHLIVEAFDFGVLESDPLVGRDAVTIDIGYKSEGHIRLDEFTTRDGTITVEEGDQIDVYFESSDNESGEIVLSRQKAEQFRVWREIEQAFEREGAVDGTIVGKVKGGLKVDIGVAAFLPGSHADLRPSRNLDRYIGQRGRFAILKFNRSRGNVVVSRRAVLERERTQLKSETLKVLEEGVILEGTVKNITDYGAFVDLGGIDGLLHVTDMSWGRVGHPSEVLNVADRVKVVVLKYDPERERVSLGMKQILPDPWTTIGERLPLNARIRGKVVSLTDYGAFVEIERGVEGLIHVSEMSWTKRVTHPSKVLEVGQEVDVQVLDVDPTNRRISLGWNTSSPIETSNG